MTEHDRQSLLSAIVEHEKKLHSLSTNIVRAELRDLPEHIASVERAAADLINRLRLLK